MLGDIYFVERALAPNHEVRADRLQTLLKQELAVIVVTDNATFGEGDREALRKWMERGGMVVRFAGEKLASDAERRSAAGARAPRRPHPRRRLVLDRAGAPRRLPERLAVRRAAGAEGRGDRAPGAGRAGHRSRRQDLGAPDRRHAAGDRRAQGRRLLRAVPCRQHRRLVEPADLRPVRRNARPAGDDRVRRGHQRRREPAAGAGGDLERLRPADAADRLRGRDRRQGLADHQGRAAASARLLRSRQPASRAQPGAVAAGVRGARHPGAASWRPTAPWSWRRPCS